MAKLTRRAILASGASALATAAVAEAPLSSLRPIGRPIEQPPKPVSDLRPRSRPDTRQYIENAPIKGDIGFAVADVQTGEVLEAIDGDVSLPPASVAKAVTGLYALKSLGGGFQYKTRLIADGPISNGILNGDLILAGGGDPRLQTDDVAELAQMLKETGIREVRGDFLVWGGALKRVEEIDPEQKDHLGYNPAVAGLNLNFNRVHFEWKQNGDDYDITMDARSAAYRADVTVSRMRVVERPAPVYQYRDLGAFDDWSVAKGALGDFGSRWLPVREPALYVGDVFRTFARSQGIVLKPAKLSTAVPTGTTLATLVSPPLRDVVRNMLRYSTNITAEACGMTATNRRTGQNRNLQTSALNMSQWCLRQSGAAPRFVDHSGLGDASRITATEMLRVLTSPGAFETLHPVLRDVRMVTENREDLPKFQGLVRAKTGTLNFVNSLAGYIRTAGGRDLAFAFFAADLEAREAGKLSGNDRPRGALTYANRARWLQQQLIQYWARTGDA